MKKKIFSLMLIAVMLLTSLFVFAGCGNDEEEDTKSSKKNKTTSQANKYDEDEEDNEKENNKNNKDNNKKDDNDKKEDNKKDKEDENKKTPSKNESKPAASLGDKFVDLDNRVFAINGKVYKLGVTTLQEMIDDGVPFDEEDLANVNNNVNKDSESQSFDIELGDYYSATIRVSNSTDGNMKAVDCPVSKIYVPVRKNQKQDVVTFAFPFTMTEEELVANAGEPTDKSEYNGSNNYVSTTYKYKVDSKKYYGSSGYTFDFVNGELQYVTIDYME